MIKSSLMEIEQKQAEIIGQLVDRASKCSGESMWPIYITSFSFRLFQDFGSPQLPRSCFRNVCLVAFFAVGIYIYIYECVFVLLSMLVGSSRVILIFAF